ncbi:MAG: hypothetical protein M4D80_24360 [Myxococcota bacterium]|nr:hypothetical protein [Deltaproteobacteria bacterium]MDQ3338312.1 hypothetical protein [Myxococcota bacterium]
MRPALALAVIAFGALGACDDTSGNAPVLWFVLDGRETEVKLAEDEPEPF